MRRHSIRADKALHGLLRHLDWAAGKINPFLMLLVIALALLDLMSFAVLSPRLAVLRRLYGYSAAPPGAEMVTTPNIVSLQSGK